MYLFQFHLTLTKSHWGQEPPLQRRTGQDSTILDIYFTKTNRQDNSSVDKEENCMSQTK